MNPFYNIGKRIFELRTREGWTQQELADRCNRTRYAPGIKQPHIAGLEKSLGDKLPSVPLLAALAEVFGLSMQEIIGLEPIDKATPNLLKGLSAEDRALVHAFVSRLTKDIDDSWDILSAAREALGDEARPTSDRLERLKL